MTTGALSCGSITSSGDFNNGSNNLTTGIATVSVLRGVGTNDTLFVDRSPIVTSANRYYAINTYYDSGASSWKYAASTGYGHAMVNASDGTFDLVMSSSASTAASSNVSSMNAMLTIDSSINNIIPRVAIVSTASATFTSMTCSSLTSSGTISCGN